MKSFILFLAVATNCLADDVVELRLSSRAEYRYVDWNHTFTNKITSDVYYIGTPGDNEFSLGGGYTLSPTKSMSITPLFYVTTTHESGSFSPKVAVFLTGEKGKWKTDAYWAHTWRVKSMLAYDLADAWNVIYSLGHAEVGISTGYFQQANTWNPLIGPLVRWNDTHGVTSLSLRFGSDVYEVRFGRVFNFKK